MRKRDESAHPVIKRALDGGYLDSGEHYRIPGFTSREAANRGRQAINNAARHLGVSCSSREAADIHDNGDGTFTVTFRLFSKSGGRKYVKEQSGGDPAKLAYNPFRRGEGPIIDPAGRPLTPS